MSTSMAVGVANGVAAGVPHAGGEMIGVQIHPDHHMRAQFVDEGGRALIRNRPITRIVPGH